MSDMKSGMKATNPEPRGLRMRTLAFGSAWLLLAGCAVHPVGPDFKRPDAPRTERYAADPAASAASGDGEGTAVVPQQIALGVAPARDWWRQFGSSQIDTVVAQALAGNRSLAAASATLAQAQALVDAKAGTLDPQIGLTAGTGRQKYGAEFLGTLGRPPPFSYFAVGPSISYHVDYTGGEARSVEQQRALAEVQLRQLDAAGLAVSGNTVMAALKIASLRAQIDTVTALLDRDRENLKLVQLALDAGSVSRLDIVSAQSQLASDATLLPPLRQQLDVARHALAVLMGSAPSDTQLPDFELAALSLPMRVPVSLPSELARRRPDILAAEAQLHAATAAVGVAEGNLYPHIDLTASTGQQAITLAHLFDRTSSVFGLAASLTAPLFDGGTLRAEKRAAVAQMQAETARYQQTVLEALGQVADALQALDHGAQLLTAQSQAQDAARLTVEMTRLSYREGNVGVLQVLDAERRFQQARLGVVRAQAQRCMDTVQLMLALGGAGVSG
jgi:NodT family efflux transporter outer membrane factor (OMF) lipoprotein